MKLQAHVLSVLLATATLIAQQTDPAPRGHDIALRFATFDPLVAVPVVPASLRAGADVHLHVVQFEVAPTDADRAAMQRSGASLRGYLPENCHLVEASAEAAASIRALPAVRWVGAYEPAYRLDPVLLAELLADEGMPTRRYHLVLADKHSGRPGLAAKVRELAGTVVDEAETGLVMNVMLDGAQLRQIARCDEVVWINAAAEIGFDMANARIQGGAEQLEAAANYRGNGVRGFVFEGVEGTHPDFQTPVVPINTLPVATDHGTCVAGIIFGDGTSHPQARGLAPQAEGFYTNPATAFTTRAQAIASSVNVHECMFGVSSWGTGFTTTYDSNSALMDDILFDHRLPWAQSMGNNGSTSARPEAWAKNVISAGAVHHNNNASDTDDSWAAGTASIGPASDNRIKPDFVGYNDSVWTTDRTGANGYALGNSTVGFGGTSAAAAMVAGHAALVIDMFTDGVFGNEPRVPGGTRFENRPHAATTKALLLATSRLYQPTFDNRREHVGWGFPYLYPLYLDRDEITVVAEDRLLSQGNAHTRQFEVPVGQSELRVCMSYTDPAANPAANLARVNNLNLLVTAPDGTFYHGNFGLRGVGQQNTSVPFGIANSIDTVECVILQNPPAGVWEVRVSAPLIAVDGEPSTASNDSSYALVVKGAREILGSECSDHIPSVTPIGWTGNYVPFGGPRSTLVTTFADNNQGSVGGSVVFDVQPNTPMTVSALELNVNPQTLTTLSCDVYLSVGSTYVGVTDDVAQWQPVSSAHAKLSTVGGGPNGGTVFLLDRPVSISNARGLMIVANNFGHRYTNGTATYSNADLDLVLGGVQNVAFSPAVASRIANVALSYVKLFEPGTNVRYQTILRSDQLGGAGWIRDLEFAPANAGRHYSSSVTVLLDSVPSGSVLSTDFAANMPTPYTAMLAQEHTFYMAANRWTPIGIQAPYYYDGVSDLVVELSLIGNVIDTVDGEPAPFWQGFEQPRAFSTSFFPASTTALAVDDRGMRMRVIRSCATASDHGHSCSPMRSTHEELPEIGGTFHFKVTGSQIYQPLFLGVSFDFSLTSPIDLSGLGWTNCSAFVAPALFVGSLGDPSGESRVPIDIPNDPMMFGTTLLGQWISLDVEEPGEIGVSGYTRMVIGDYE